MTNFALVCQSLRFYLGTSFADSTFISRAEPVSFQAFTKKIGIKTSCIECLEFFEIILGKIEVFYFFDIFSLKSLVIFMQTWYNCTMAIGENYYTNVRGGYERRYQL